MHFDYQNCRIAERAALRPLSGGGVPEIFAVFGAEEFFRGQMSNYYPYPCERCGNCCRHVDLIAGMEHFNRGDGVCKHLREDNLCAIYAERPPLCNGEYVYKTFFATVPVEEFHEMISKLCIKLKEAEA